jgi:hypothetical protein
VLCWLAGIKIYRYAAAERAAVASAAGKVAGEGWAV